MRVTLTDPFGDCHEFDDVAFEEDIADYVTIQRASYPPYFDGAWVCVIHEGCAGGDDCGCPRETLPALGDKELWRACDPCACLAEGLGDELDDDEVTAERVTAVEEVQSQGNLVMLTVDDSYPVDSCDVCGERRRLSYVMLFTATAEAS